MPKTFYQITKNKRIRKKLIEKINIKNKNKKFKKLIM